MRSGMTANVTFFVASKNGVPTIPSDAIKSRNDQVFVLVPAPDSPYSKDKPIHREVETGLSDGKRTEVISGLEVGEKILVPEFHASGTPKSSGNNPLSPFGGRRGR
jgi:multidrug efflux pump subunit AcrA (membrane-fusion protein)